MQLLFWTLFWSDPHQPTAMPSPRPSENPQRTRVQAPRRSLHPSWVTPHVGRSTGRGPPPTRLPCPYAKLLWVSPSAAAEGERWARPMLGSEDAGLRGWPKQLRILPAALLLLQLLLVSLLLQ